MTQMMWEAYAATAFGLEGLAARELRAMGMQDVRTENGGVRFTADTAGLMACNLQARMIDRIYILLAEKECLTFEDLFQLASHIRWERYMGGTEFIDIRCKCVRSKLMSPRDCQSITKKAVIEALKWTTGRTVFPESGPSMSVLLTIRNDHAMILLNTSGDSLSRRGYRTWNGEAPLRETLAAALVELSPWQPGIALHDPCCGTGTILIEAAFRAAERASGLNRTFAMEQLPFAEDERMKELRKKARAAFQPERISGISGSDIDAEALRLAGLHVKQAGLQDRIPLRNVPLQQLQLETEQGVFICNPPYGERLSDQNHCRKLYRDLHALKDRHPGWALCAISSDAGFEKAYGRRADTKRRLYNGRLECNYYIYS